MSHLEHPVVGCCEQDTTDGGVEMIKVYPVPVNVPITTMRPCDLSSFLEYYELTEEGVTIVERGDVDTEEE